MTNEEVDLARLASEIGLRIRHVCPTLTDAVFGALCLTMASVQRRGEQRSAREWGALTMSPTMYYWRRPRESPGSGRT